MTPPKTSTYGRSRCDAHELYVGIRTGSLWCTLSKEYGSLHTIYNNFRKWSQEGVMENIFRKLTVNTEETT